MSISRQTRHERSNRQVQVPTCRARLLAAARSRLLRNLRTCNTPRGVVSIAASLNLESDGTDIKGAYLNSELKEEIHMRQPPGHDNGTGHVWQLHKALYRLKQAGRA